MTAAGSCGRLLSSPPEPPDPEAVAAELHRLITEGALEPRATQAVLEATGKPNWPPPNARKSRRPVYVPRLAAKGLTTPEIADRLFISPKSADDHIPRIYNKITVSTRAAAALWTLQNAIVQ